MSKVMHTPGPWTFHEIGDGRRQTKFMVYESMDINGKIKSSTDWICYIPNLKPQDEANARLIAAAPDMLDVCFDSLNALTDYVERLEMQGSTMGYGRSVIEKLKHTIAIAEGRE